MTICSLNAFTITNLSDTDSDYIGSSETFPVVLNGISSLSFAVAFCAGINRRTQLLASGTCGCLGYDLTQGDDYRAVIAELAYVNDYIAGFSEDVQRQIVEMTCSGVLNYGEQGQVTITGVYVLLRIGVLHEKRYRVIDRGF